MANFLLSIFVCFLMFSSADNFLKINYTHKTILLLCESIANNCLVFIDNDTLIKPYFDDKLVNETIIYYLNNTLKPITNSYKYKVEYLSNNKEEIYRYDLRLSFEIKINLISTFRTSKLLEVNSVYE